MHREGQPTNWLALSCAFFALMRNQKADSTVKQSLQISMIRKLP